MEKEQIVKALEYCTSGGACYECQYDDNPLLSREGCMARKMFNALSLILEQDKRIEELEAENEKLKNPRYMVHSDGRIEMIPSVECVRNDTVRKMQEAIKERCIKGGIYPAFVARTVEAVADELLENAVPTNLVSLEDVSKAIKDYCCELIVQGKDAVEATEFNADIQKRISAEIFGKAEHDEKT